MRENPQPPCNRLDRHRQGFGNRHHAEAPAADSGRSHRQPQSAPRGSHDYALQHRLRCHRIDSTERPALARARGRLIFAAAAFCCAGALVAIRLVDLTLSPKPASTQTAAALTPDFRADILDRNGVLLATQVETSSLYADPARIMDPVATAEQLASVLPDLNAASLAEKLGNQRSRFVWIKRQLSPAEYDAVHRLGLPGVEVRDEPKRFYPQGNSFSHLLGFTSIDNEGLAGIEQEFDQRLRTERQPLKLSVDARVQEVVRDALADAMHEFRAIGATGIVMDAHTGEVIAMSSLPDYDPQHPAESPAENRFNRAVQGVYELGSTFKIFTSAMALDSGRMTMRDGFDTRDPIRVGRFTISDYHPESRWLSIPEIFMYSSNIGTAHMAMAVGTQAQRRFLTSLGLTQRLPIELPEAATPLVPQVWRDVNTMTISYGHGIAVTPMHLVGAVGAMVNGGTYESPTLLALNDPENVDNRPHHRVISPETSANIRRLMRLVVEHGTGRKGDAKGYIVGGKTGTADKPSHGHYAEHKLISSFVAAFPMHDPQYVVLATLDEPKGNQSTYGFATAGWTAAPTVSRIVSEIAPILGLAPHSDSDPKVRRALDIRFDGPVIENDPEPTPMQGTTLASY